MSPPADARGLTFHWPDPRQVSFLMPGFFLVSIFLHALTFYVFQVVYPPYVSITPPPTQVTLLTPDSPQGQAMLRWVEAEDPAALLATHELDVKTLLNVRYRPSFADVRSSPRSDIEEKVAVRFPSAVDGLSMIENAAPRVQAIESRAQFPGTVIRFSNTLANRKRQERQPLHINPRSKVTPEPSEFMVGVTADGEVRYIFLQHSSGDKSMDAQAETYLQTVSFDPDSQAITWGFVTFLWGSDACDATPQPETGSQKPNDPR